MKACRRIFVCFVILLNFNACQNAREHRPFSKVLLISLDTLRPDFLGCYNGKRTASPNLDRFARENIQFTQVTSQAPSTAISHKSILYSLYPSIHQTTRNRIPLEFLKSPLETLQLNGYKTAGFVGGGELSSKFGFAKGFETYWESGKYSYSDSKESLELLENKLNDWLGRNYTEQFLLFCHTYEIHCPYYAPKEFRDRTAGWYKGEINPAGKCGDNFYNLKHLSDEDVQFMRDLYSAEIEYVDSFFGRLMDRLKRLGIYNETLIIVLSDHGESLGERSYTGHNYLYNTQLQIPLLMRVPGVSSQVINSPVEAVDVIPTVFALLDMHPPYTFQGENLLPVIYKNAVFNPNRVLFSEQSARVRIRIGNMTSIFSADGNGVDEVYDLLKDPEERINLSEQYSTFLILCKQEYFTMMEEAQPISSQFLIEGTEAKLDHEIEMELRALGYLQ